MEDENEVLDWEDDEEQTHGGNGGPVDDADGVSLGSDSGDENENAAASTSAAIGAARNSPGAQDANGNPRPVSPKSTSLSVPPMEREDSSSSLNTNKRKDSSPRTSPRPHNRQNRSRANKPLTPSAKMIHGLPPKPVGLNVPTFLPPSHPSLTEATAMSTRESGKGKNGGNKSNAAPKPVSSEGRESPLPPDWQIRHSRSEGQQVYYYNTRTHESTWTRPSSHSSTRPGHHSRDDSIDTKYADSPSLTYEDRHYRPGAPGALDDPHTNKRGNVDSWYGSPDYGRHHGPDEYPAPDSPQSRRHRSLSPGPSARGREAGRRSRVFHQPPSRGLRHANSDRDRDMMCPPDVDSDQHWGAPANSGHSKSRRHPRQPQHPQDHPDAPGMSSHEPYSDREKPMGRQLSHSRRSTRGDRADRADRVEDQEPNQNQNLIHRHRSPPPHMREQDFIERAPLSDASAKRDRPSRFAPPPAPVHLGEDEEAWVPDEFNPDLNRQQAQEDRVGQRTGADSSRVSKTGRSPSPRVATSDAQQSAPRRKRQPLPPQSMRFREVSKSNNTPNPVPGVIVEAAPANSSVAAPQEMSLQSLPPPRLLPASASSRTSTMTRDPPPHQRVTKFGPPKTDVDLPAGPRYFDQPSSGRSGEDGRNDDRERRDLKRAAGAHDYYASSSGPPDFADSIPSPSSSRYRRSPSADSSIRAGPGAYIDRSTMGYSAREREVTEDPVPRGPRAMGSQTGNSTSPVNMYPNRTRDRSPPSFETNEQHGPPLRPDFDASRSGRESSSGGHGQRKRPPHLGKGPAVSRQPPPHLSGTNNIPVGQRHNADNNTSSGPSKSSSNRYSLPPAPPPGISGANTVPLKNSRYPTNPGPDASASSRLPSSPPRAAGSIEIRRLIDAQTVHALPARPISRMYSPPPPPDDPPSKSVPRAATPPPSSREPSTTSPNWDYTGSEHGRSSHHRGAGDAATERHDPDDNSTQVAAGSRSAEGGLQQRLDASRTGNGYVPHGLPMNPSLRMPPQGSAPDGRSRGEGGRGRPISHMEPRRDSGRLPDVHHTLPERPDVPPARASKSQRPPAVSQSYGADSSNNMDVDISEPHRRPTPARRGGSLLDRLSLDDRGDEGLSGTPLRDRVQIPSKRDRDDLRGAEDRFGMNVDVDDGVVGDGNPKRRRRSGKPRRGRGRGPGASYP